MGKKVVNENHLLEGANKSRRKFVKRVLVGTAFAAPLIASFPMNGLKADSARAVTFGNQTCSGGCENLPPLKRLVCFILQIIARLSGHC